MNITDWVKEKKELVASKCSRGKCLCMNTEYCKRYYITDPDPIALKVIERYREALEYYADEEHLNVNYPSKEAEQILNLNVEDL